MHFDNDPKSAHTLRDGLKKRLRSPAGEKREDASTGEGRSDRGREIRRALARFRIRMVVGDIGYYKLPRKS